MKRVLLIFMIITLVGCTIDNGGAPPEAPNTIGDNGQELPNGNDIGGSEADDDTPNGIGGSGVSGVWMGFYVPYWQYSPVERYLLVYEDGTLFHDLPLSGLDNFDPEASKSNESEMGYWGTYTLDNNKGTYCYNQSQQPWEMALGDDGTLSLGTDKYYRTKSVNGLRLNGSWSTTADPETANMEIDGLKSIIRFTPDGQFLDEGLMSGFFDYCDLDFSRGPGAGTYEIKNYTLHLSYDDGRTRAAAFSLFLSHAPEETPELIYIHRTALHLLDD